ncbi:MAG: sigma-70 family RNA polymerase sigma factor [Oscillospiraceae bacterium]|nr:sigma-70 family RNA polymerase sigma factor [Oscillospiraceae bacterium]
MPETVECPRADFIERNIGLAHACANRFRGRGIEYDDLFQAACCGLIKACDHFDASRGLMFSTYAVPVILGEVRRLFRDGGSVKVSRRLKEIARKANAAHEELRRQSDEEPSVHMLAQIIDCDEETLIQALCCARAPVSLSEMAQDEDGERDIPVNDAGYEQITETLSLRAAVERLSAQERLVLRERFYHNKTQTQTASEIGSSQVGVSRMEKKILLKLRGFLEEPL